MTARIDLVADLNAEDDDGLGWSTISSAVDPSIVVKGRVLVAGNSQAYAAVRIDAVDADGQVHFEILPGAVSKHPPVAGLLGHDSVDG